MNKDDEFEAALVVAVGNRRECLPFHLQHHAGTVLGAQVYAHLYVKEHQQKEPA